MNEKIKQLVKQAEQYALDRANEGSDEDYDYAFDDDFRQKFSELIILECCNMVSKRPYVDDGVSIYLHPSTIIKKHFGVE